jgi:hypothetical protein
MKSFLQFLSEENDIVLATPKNIVTQTEEPKQDHRRHPMGQFLSFIKSELPNIDVEDSPESRMYQEELGKHIDTITGEDPKHFEAMHADLKGDYEQPTLFDVLYRVTNKVGRATEARFKKEVHRGGIDPDDLRDIIKAHTDHINDRADTMIRARARKNPKFSMIDTLNDISI